MYSICEHKVLGLLIIRIMVILNKHDRDFTLSGEQ